MCELLEELLSSNGDNEMWLLAECVHRKTGGNPFYVKQFLLSLQSDGLLAYHPNANTQGRWIFNVAKLTEAAEVTENVLALLTEKLRELPDDLRTMVPRIACLGTAFSASSAEVLIGHFASSAESAEAQYYSGDFVNAKKLCEIVRGLDFCPLLKKRRVVSEVVPSRMC